MDSQTVEFAATVVDNHNLVHSAFEALSRRNKLVRYVLQHKRLPEIGWDSVTLDRFVSELALLDSNNFIGNVGAGEREGRIECDVVRRRHWGLAHGIGRSGEIGAVQPKAAGSSIILKLCTELLRDLIRSVCNMRSIKGVLLLPVATGMSVSIVLQCLRWTEAKRRETSNDGNPQHLRYVLWPRIDQKTCLKAIYTAGFTPIIVEGILDGDQVKTNIEMVQKHLEELGESILCVLSTTSCFAPRIPDDVEGIAKLCDKYNVAHVINNAYGLQCNKCCHSIDQACRIGRVDAIVQSTDKNLLVPVGGAFVIGPNKSFIESELSKSYPGRASISPILDVFLTLLSLGRTGFQAIRKRRIDLVALFRTEIEKIASKYGERVLQTYNRNTISFAISLSCVDGDNSSATKLGSMIFTRGVSGARVVAPQMKAIVAGNEFPSYGASHSKYPCTYLTVACAIGVDEKHIYRLMKKLDKTLQEFVEKQTK